MFIDHFLFFAFFLSFCAHFHIFLHIPSHITHAIRTHIHTDTYIHNNHIVCGTLFETITLRPMYSYATYILFSQTICNGYLVWLHGSHTARPMERERFLFLLFISSYFVLCSLIIVPLSRASSWCSWKFILYRYLRYNLKLTNVIYRTAEFTNKSKKRIIDVSIFSPHWTRSSKLDYIGGEKSFPSLHPFSSSFFLQVYPYDLILSSQSFHFIVVIKYIQRKFNAISSTIDNQN